MYRIPEKYFNTRYGRESRAIIRHCLASGMKVVDVAEQLTNRYRKAGAAVRRHIGNMLPIVYDFGMPDLAQNCARLFGYKLRDDFNVSQSVFIDGYAVGERLCWRNKYSQKVEYCRDIIASFPAGKWRMLVAPGCVKDVMSIDTRHNLFAVVDASGALNLFVPENNPSDILVDEECFSGEPPLYFTEHTHFTSPVYKVSLAETIFSYCLEQIGFPYIEVKKKVIFTSDTAGLINRDEYSQSEEWKGVEIIMQRDVTDGYIFGGSRPLAISTEPEMSPANQLLAALLYSLTATGMLFELAFSNGLPPNVGADTLKRMCRSLGIFVK